MDKTVGLLGGGQLGRMLIERANRLNILVNVLDAENSPAKQVGAHPRSRHITGSFKDRDAILQLAASCDVVTAEIEHIDAEVLKDVSEKVQPHWTTFQIIQDKYRQKEHLRAHNVPTAWSVTVDSVDEATLKATGEKLGFPFMLKTRLNAYDGRGNVPIRSAADVPAAIEAFGGLSGGLYAEQWADFEKELAVMVVKTASDTLTESNTLAFPTVETEHEDSICKLVYAPARGLTATTSRAAQDLAKRAVATFGGKGVFGVEMFLLKADGSREGTLLVNEIAPRPHNSGHYLQDACHLDQFEAHLRAILDLPIPESSLNMIPPAAIMLNLLGTRDPEDLRRVIKLALASTNATIHLYGKAEARPGRKMGHINVTAPSMAEAEAIIGPLIKAVDVAHGKRTGPISNDVVRFSPTLPVVGVISGSISDQPKMEGCYKILNRLGVKYERGIVSAHRTPEKMAEYASTAAERGIKVIIAAAGGAAHLQGMTAAFSKVLPVIGLPIKPTIGDGTDSLVSCTNMPNGVPVLTVGVDKAINAALGAARILALWDPALMREVRAYADEAEAQSLENDRQLKEL